MDIKHWPQMSGQQRKRTLFVIKYLETGSDSAAAKSSGLSCRHTRQRIAEHLKEHGTLAEAPHPRQSPKYTESVMKAALGYFKDKSGDHFTTPELVSYLIEDGILEEPVDEQNFRQHFEEWLHTQGMTLAVGCKKLIFEIVPAGAAERLKFVQEHSALVATPERLKEMIIVDETTFEEGPHPKGKGTKCKACRQGQFFEPFHSRTCTAINLVQLCTAGLSASSMFPAAIPSWLYANMEFLFAGQKVYEGYLYIPQIQNPVEKKHTSRHKDKVGRRKLLVIIFLRLGYDPLPIICSGSDFPGMPELKKYYHETGKKQQYVDLNQFEYIDCLKTAVPQLTSQDPGRVGLRGADDLVVLHDSERAHLARSVAEFAEQQRPRRLRLVALPRHSPDLTPHDSGFLAEVKRTWHRAIANKDMPWAQQCEEALQIIRKTDPEPYIREMPLRWRACELEQGQHIEQRLKELKKESRAHDGEGVGQ
jgi:hypothetical protein